MANGNDVTIRAMAEDDLAAADRIFRLAFGTFFALPDPMTFRGDAALIVPRWHTYRDGGVVAESEDGIVGMSFVSRWGSLGVLGPVAVHPTLWRHGVAQRLLAATLAIADGWHCRLVGLFTFPQSAGHLRLYQSFGFWPRHFVPVMAKPVTAAAPVPQATSLRAAASRPSLVAECRALTEAAFAGLDLGHEIDTVVDRGLGDVILLNDDSGVAGFAICHTGIGSEGGSDACYIKFAMVRPDDGAGSRLTRLVFACEHFAHRRGAQRLSAGVATGRHDAYRIMVGLGFRMQLAGIAMHRPHAPAYDGPETYALDDWR